MDTNKKLKLSHNSNKNSSSISSSKDEVKLNIFIFREIAVYLAYNSNSFKSLLELSLLSKSIFKVFQNILISPNYNKNSILPLTSKQLANYISNDSVNKNKYSLKLIQFRDIEKIKLVYDKNVQNDKLDPRIIAKYSDLMNLKKVLNKYCTKLKQVVFVNKIYMETGNGAQDKTIKGYFQFNKLEMFWYGEERPDFDENIEDDKFENVYSFKSLKNYKPKKIYISTIIDVDYGLNLDNLDGILKFNKSIESITFETHETPNSFIEKVFKQSNIKSLKLEIKVTDGSFLNSLGKGNTITKNSTLKKLILSNSYHFLNVNSNLKNIVLEQVLRLINTNQSIVSLGLHAFKIQDSNLLLPLINNSRITTLYCNVISLESHLIHCNQNSNIKHLHVFQTNINDDDDENDDDDDEGGENYSEKGGEGLFGGGFKMGYFDEFNQSIKNRKANRLLINSINVVQLLSNFFNNNNSKLQSITLKIDYLKDNDILIIKESFEKSKTFKMLNLIIKN